MLKWGISFFDRPDVAAEAAAASVGESIADTSSQSINNELARIRSRFFLSFNLLTQEYTHRHVICIWIHTAVVWRSHPPRGVVIISFSSACINVLSSSERARGRRRPF